MCSTKVDISKESLDSSKLPFNRKTFLAEQFLFYKTLVGNKLRFTNSQSYEYIFGRNFVGNNLFDLEEENYKKTKKLCGLVDFESSYRLIKCRQN